MQQAGVPIDAIVASYRIDSIASDIVDEFLGDDDPARLTNLYKRLGHARRSAPPCEGPSASQVKQAIVVLSSADVRKALQVGLLLVFVLG